MIWWNPVAENQATVLAYRMGQDKPVFVCKLVTSGTIEEKILEMQDRKAALTQGILCGALGEVLDLTGAEVKELLS